MSSSFPAGTGGGFNPGRAGAFLDRGLECVEGLLCGESWELL